MPACGVNDFLIHPLLRGLYEFMCVTTLTCDSHMGEHERLHVVMQDP